MPVAKLVGNSMVLFSSEINPDFMIFLDKSVMLNLVECFDSINRQSENGFG